MNYFPFYPGDYLRETADLSLAQHGAYLLLLNHYYGTESAPPSDRASLYRICRAVQPEEMFAVDSVVDRFFFERGGRMVNARCEGEIRKAKRTIAASRANGSKGGRPPKQNPEKTQQVSSGIPSGNPTGNPAETQWGAQRITQPGDGVGVGVGDQEHVIRESVVGAGS